MAQSKKVSFLRGKRMRATELDAFGRPVFGESSVITTKGVVSLSYKANIEAGTAISIPNMNGETCLSEPATPTFTGFTVDAEFCEVDFALLGMLTGQELYVDEDGVIIGLTESTDVDMSDVHFALEMWLGSTNPGEYGYMITPNLSGGTIADVKIENGAISFNVTGMSTKNGTAWGVGPYKVETVGGAPSALRTPLQPNDHRRTFATTVAPPAVFTGATPLLDPADPALTSITATVTGKSVAIAPTPAGTDPIFYEFGDGKWDYAETGSYTHVYEFAGTYTITAQRGSSTVTTSVTVL